MTRGEFQLAQEQRIERMVRELASDLAGLVEAGDLTDEQANEWLVSKQDQWVRETD